MAKRTDIHRSGVIEPNDYEFVSCDYYGPSEGDIGEALFFKEQRKNFLRHKEMTGGSYSRHEHGGTCHVCGALALHVCKFYHVKSNSYIVMGHQCAAKWELGDPALFRKSTRTAKEVRDRIAGKAKAKLILSDAEKLRRETPDFCELGDLNDAYKFWEMDFKEAEKMGLATETNTEWCLMTLNDIVGKLIQYGSLSEKQLAFLSKLVTQCKNLKVIKEEREARYAAERANAKDVPNDGERHTVLGEVMSVREPDEYDLYPNWKMLFKTDEGYKLWGNVPTKMKEAADGAIRDLVGKRFEFTARLKASDKDSKFGFYSRPTKIKELVV